MTITLEKPKSTTTHHSGALDHDGLSAEWIQLEKIMGFRPAFEEKATVQEQRKGYADFNDNRDSRALTYDLKNLVVTEDDEIDVDDGTRIAVRIYRPKEYDGKVLPAAVFYHGGGWRVGSIQGDDWLCRMIVRDSKHVVVSVEYRLAPEHPFPTPVNDAYAGFLWALKNAERLGIDKSKVYVTGDSAGGNLSAAVALKVAESDNPSALAAQILRIPFTCHPDFFPVAVPDRNTAPILTTKALMSMIDAYVPNKEDRASPYFSPLLASPELLKKLPPTYIEVCGADPLYENGIVYAKKLEDCGVPVRLFILEGMPHGSFMGFPELNSSKVAHAKTAEATKWALEYSS